MSNAGSVETARYPTYRLNGITWLPHYRRPVFVSPGYPKYNLREMSGKALMELGADRVDCELWRRSDNFLVR